MSASPDIILSARSICKSFLDFQVLNDVHLDVARGSIHSVIGPNGAGKTTLFNVMTRFLDPSGGQIFFNGADITKVKAAQVARRGMVRSFQISAIFPSLSVLENVRVALQRKRTDDYHFWKSVTVLRELNDRARSLLSEVGLEDLADLTAMELSYGRRRALEIATTLALDPELMLLDEPTSGMGHEDIERITKLIRRVSAHRTIIMVEHNLSVVANLSDRITVLARGEIIADGDYEHVSKDPAVIEAYMGTDSD